VGVVFCVAVIFRREEILSYGGDAGGCGCEEGGEVRCHCGVMPPVGGKYLAL
jgi:hypothetical protein